MAWIIIIMSHADPWKRRMKLLNLHKIAFGVCVCVFLFEHVTPTSIQMSLKFWIVSLFLVRRLFFNMTSKITIIKWNVHTWQKFLNKRTAQRNWLTVKRETTYYNREARHQKKYELGKKRGETIKNSCSFTNNSMNISRDTANKRNRLMVWCITRLIAPFIVVRYHQKIISTVP